MPDLHALDANVREFAARVGEDYRRFEDRYEGAVPRSVKEFGAKGTGAVDDTAAFQAAVDAVGNGIVIVPPGVYPIHDINVTMGTLIVCQAGPSEVTQLAGGSQLTAVTLRYNGPGGAGSRMFSFKATEFGQWIKGCGIVGRPHLNGNHICEVLISAASMHAGNFDVEMSRATQVGMSVNGANGVLTQFCNIDFKYIWGALAATEASHGLVMNGNAPGTTDWVGCTQNYVHSNGAVKNGDMIRMVGHCDNNHIWAHATQGVGAGKGTGNTLAVYQGNGGVAARINHIHYACGSIFLQVGSFGTHFDFLTSEGMTIAGGGQFTYGVLLDYITGKAFESLKAPSTLYQFIGAAEMLQTGAATKGVISGGGTPVISMPKSGNGGAAFMLHDRVWGAGTLAQLEMIYRTPTGSGNVQTQTEVTISQIGEGLAVDATVTDLIAVSGANNQQHQHVFALPMPAKAMLGFHIQRLPANPSDTLTGDAQLVGVIVRGDFYGPASLEAALPPWQEQKA